MKLFVRRTDGVALTPAGAALARRADSLLAAAATAAEEVAQTASGTLSAVRLAAFPSAAATIVPTAMVRLRRRHPALELDVVLEDPPASVELVRHVGVALLPSLALEATHDRDLAVLRLDRRPTRTIAALVRREAASRPTFRALVAALSTPASGHA